MPNSELHRIAKGNLESTQTKMSHCSTDLDFPPDNEFVELVCENGQILMQGQSNKTRKNISGFPSFSSKAQEKDGEDAVIPTFSKFGNMSTILNDFSSSSGHLSNMGLGQDDDIVPWLNYPLDDGLQHDYCSEFFSELTGVNMNALSSQNNAVPIEKNNGYSQIVRDSHIVSVHGDANPEEKNKSKVAEGIAEPPKPRGSQLYHSPLKECQTPVPPLRPKVSDFISYNGNSDHQASCRNSNQTPPVSVANTKMQRQDSGSTRILPASAGLMNFSHFARPAALAKANLQNITVGVTPGSSSMDKLRNNEKISSVGSSPMGSTTAELTSGSRIAAGFQNQNVSVSGKLGVNSSTCKSPKEVQRVEQTGAVCREDASRSNKLPDQVHRQNSSVAASTNVGSTEKDVEPIVASSSICSGNSAGAASNDPKHILKRKTREVEESECQSDDVEEESMGAKKPATARGGMGAKRSRAAEVHNLSERRRRDRINEKMRALQELIPNCNKVDKASMLDEAIEYLKTLQLQVQIMSMGTGLYMPQMMLPTGMQRMHPQHLPHFNPMGVGMGMGMGMGMGYGMGMVDMSNGSSACPVMQMPRMHGVQYPCPSFPPVAGSNLQMFGLPGQGHPLSMPRVPYIPPSEGPSTSSVPVLDVSLTATPPDRPGSAPSSSSQDPKLSMNSQMMQKTSAGCSPNQTPQVQEGIVRDRGVRPSPATREGFDQSAAVQRNDQALRVGSNGNINSSNGNGLGTSRAGYN